MARPARRARRSAGRSPFIGAKGGVAAPPSPSTWPRRCPSASKEPTLLIDLHLAHGDAAVFLGVEPRFSVVDALENIHRLDEAYLKGLVTTTKAGVDLLASSTNLLRGACRYGARRSLIEFAATCTATSCWTARGATPRCSRRSTRHRRVVVLANQELTTLRTASRMLTALRQRCGNERVKLGDHPARPEVRDRTADVERCSAGRSKYLFPNDYRTSLGAITRGEPLILQNHSLAGQSFEKLLAISPGSPPKRTRLASRRAVRPLGDTPLTTDSSETDDATERLTAHRPTIDPRSRTTTS